jgi:hypothetical protein
MSTEVAEDVEKKVFEEFMTRHAAQLLSHAKPYIDRLVPEQREEFLAFALNQAWEKREQLKPRKNQYGAVTLGILRWWEDNCLRPAALSRKTWTLRTFDRRREFVPGHKLGKRN